MESQSGEQLVAEAAGSLTLTRPGARINVGRRMKGVAGKLCLHTHTAGKKICKKKKPNKNKKKTTNQIKKKTNKN
jgi:hypothetical protein